MLYEFRLPDAGSAEVEMLGWEVREGDRVAADQVVCRVLAGKAEVEVRCPQRGVLLKQVARIGDQVRLRQLVAIIRPEEAAPPAPSAPAPSAQALPAVRKLAAELKVDLSAVKGSGPGGRITEEDVRSALRPEPEAPAQEKKDITAPIESPDPDKTLVSDVAHLSVEGLPELPVLKKPAEPAKPAKPAKQAPLPELPAEKSLTLEDPALAPAAITPQGPVVGSDSFPQALQPEQPSAPVPPGPPASPWAAEPVEEKPAPSLGIPAAALAAIGVPQSGTPPQQEKGGLPAPAAITPQGPAVGSDSFPQAPPAARLETAPPDEERIAFVGPRKRAADRLAHSWKSIPHAYCVAEADVTSLRGLMRELQPEARKRGCELSELAFVLRALAKTLHEIPDFNSHAAEDGHGVALKRSINVGIAMTVGHALVVPVLHEIQKKDLWTLACELSRLPARARDHNIPEAELHGATFTVTSVAGAPSNLALPVVLQPETASLGVTKAAERAVVIGGGIHARWRVSLGLSYDSRVHDAGHAAAFLSALGRRLEAPRSLA